MRCCALFLSLAMTSFASVAGAQTVTVAKSGTPDFTTIQAAIDSGASVVQITDGAVYDEIITINESLVLTGTGPQRPIIAVQTNTTANPADMNDGLNIFITENNADITLSNLIVIPSTTNPPADDIIRVNTAVGVTNPVLAFDNILVTANNGSDQPVTTDPFTEIDLGTIAGLVPVGDDCIFIAGAAGADVTVTITNSVFTHNQSGANADGIVVSVTGVKSVTIGDGCVISYQGRLGVQANGSETFKIDAPNNPVKIIGSKGFAGLWYAAPQSVERSVNGLIVADVVGNGTTTGWGVENQNRGSITATFSNMILANNNRQGFMIGSVGDGDTVLSNVTFAGNGTAPFNNSAGSDGNITITDSILAGNGGTEADEVIVNAGNGTVDISFSAVVTNGPFTLHADTTGGAGTINQASVINADPQFLETEDFTSLDYFRPSNAAYSTAGTGGSELLGGAAMLTSERDWILY